MQEFHQTPKWNHAGDPIAQLSNVIADIRAFCRPENYDARVHALIAASHAPEDEEAYIKRLGQALEAALDLKSDLILDCSSLPRAKTVVRALASHKGGQSRLVLCGLSEEKRSALQAMNVYHGDQLVLRREQDRAFPVYPDIGTAAAELLGPSVAEIKGQAASCRERLELKLGEFLRSEDQSLSSAHLEARNEHPSQAEAVFRQMGFKNATLLLPQGHSYTDSGQGEKFASDFRAIAAEAQGPIILDLTTVTALSGEALGVLIEQSLKKKLTIVWGPALPTPLPKVFNIVGGMQEALDGLG